MIVQNEDDEIQNNETPAEEENIIQNNKEIVSKIKIKLQIKIYTVKKIK